MDKKITGDKYKKFLDDLKSRVTDSRYNAVLTVNREMIFLYQSLEM